MKALFTDLFKYTHAMNQELIQCVSEAKPSDEKIMSLLSHLIAAHGIWNSRLAGQKAVTGVWDLRETGELVVADKENYLTTIGLIDWRDPDSMIAYTNTKGIDYRNSVRDVLFHIVNHSTHHRAQVAYALRQEGHKPPVSDYIFYRR